MSQPVPPTTSSQRFSCPHCGAYAHQDWYDIRAESIRDNGLPKRYSADTSAQVLGNRDLPADTKARIAAFFERAGAGDVFFEGEQDSFYSFRVTNLSLSECYSCRKVAVWVHDRLVYPPARQGDGPNQDLPPEVIGDFEEARTIVTASPRGAAALLRLCIQKLCDHLGETDKDLNDAIASLVSKGLDARVQQALDIVRVIGNEAVHPGILDLKDDRDTATELFRLVNLIAESMISQPKRIRAMYDGLPAGKRKAIEARDKEGR